MNIEDRNRGQRLEELWTQYRRGVDFNTRIGLYDTVAANENFYIAVGRRAGRGASHAGV